MRKTITKIICFTAAAAVSLGVAFTTACSNVYGGNKLDGNISGDVSSNGGFAVEKGDYVYFINGQAGYDADNTYGSVVKGAIMRISKSDLSSRNYSKVDTVVPQIAYSGNSNSGIFIYGDYIYYATPSTAKNSEGEVQNSYLEFKRSKLDGTEAMKDYFLIQSDNSVEYRYVEVGDTVYLVYVADSEDYYGTGSSYKNLHSLNTSTGVDTMLAYNVENVIFDSQDLTNERVYYTMTVTDFALSTTSDYNQIYTVTADATTPQDHSEYFNEVFKDEEDGYDPAKDPKYVNCGTLVYDGIGYVQTLLGNVSYEFNGEGADKVSERSAFTYTLSQYCNGTLFYTRSTEDLDAQLFAAKEQTILSDSWNPVTGNDGERYINSDSSKASSYIYLFNNDKIENVLILDSMGIIKASIDGDGTISDTFFDDAFYITADGEQATLLYLDEANNYIYYSISGGNGYSVYRVNYSGSYSDYYNPFGEEVNEYTSVRILDLDSASGWYKPEIIENQILFASQTENMVSYPYIMACDLRNKDNGLMTNEQIDELNELYSGIEEDISEIDEDIYANLPDALRYAFYSNDGEYVSTLVQAYQDVLGYDEEYYWSKESVAKYNAFVAAQEDGDWGKYSQTVKVNGTEIAANKRDYYYSLLGKMSEDDAETYDELIKTTYLTEYPVTDKTWFESLSTGEKVGFIIGVCAGGLIVIGAAVVVGLVIYRKQKSKLPTYTKKRIKVDTTDDKDIDVYAD